MLEAQKMLLDWENGDEKSTSALGNDERLGV